LDQGVDVDDNVADEFTEFVAHRTHALLRVAYALTGDQHSAEDLVQGALAKAFVRWRQIRGEAEPYVRRTIYHDSVTRWRRRFRRAETTVAAPPERASTPDDTDLRLVLRDALLALPPRQRAVLVLRYLEDRSVDETAEVLGLHRGTVASQTNRALAKLRDAVADLGKPSTYPERVSE
jgi:RNA polymerase sigma-70 factor (sigma-E family)